MAFNFERRFIIDNSKNSASSTGLTDILLRLLANINENIRMLPKWFGKLRKPGGIPPGRSREH